MPNALIEAMSAQLPVVATAVGGTPEVVVDGETGILVPPSNPQALAEAITTLLHNPDLCHEMGRAGRARIERHFTIGETVRRTESLYETLLRERGL
jgi:glycosyltransferase involved in cell wall biosynthesis